MKQTKEKKENWEIEYWKLWGHLKDTPMAKKIWSLFENWFETEEKEWEEVLKENREMAYISKKEALKKQKKELEQNHQQLRGEIKKLFNKYVLAHDIKVLPAEFVKKLEKIIK